MSTSEQSADAPTGEPGINALSYMDPSFKQLGRICVFTPGQPHAVTGRAPIGFVGLLVGGTGSGAVFTCDRQVAQGIADWQHQEREELRDQRLASGDPQNDVSDAVDEVAPPILFDGDTLVVDQTVAFDDPDAVDRIRPDEEGQYLIGWNWEWIVSAPWVCDRIIGTLPSPHDVQRYIILTHTDLQVPHDRLTVGALRAMPTRNWTALSAELYLDGEFVGHIEDNGNGGGIEIHSPNDLFGWKGIRDYAAACRLHGNPVNQEAVLHLLIAEHETAQQVAEAEANDGAVVRLLGPERELLELLTFDEPIDRQGPAREDLVRRLNLDFPDTPGYVWQHWSDRQHWSNLGLAAGYRPHPALPKPAAGGQTPPTAGI